MTILFIILLVALCAALGYAVRLLLESRAREEALLGENVALRQNNGALVLVSAMVLASAHRQARAASALRAENARHVTSLNMVLTEMEKVR